MLIITSNETWLFGETVVTDLRLPSHPFTPLSTTRQPRLTQVGFESNAVKRHLLILSAASCASSLDVGDELRLVLYGRLHASRQKWRICTPFAASIAASLASRVEKKMYFPWRCAASMMVSTASCTLGCAPLYT
jgi:hypothetical protein